MEIHLKGRLHIPEIVKLVRRVCFRKVAALFQTPSICVFVSHRSPFFSRENLPEA